MAGAPAVTPSSLPSRGARPHLPDGVTVNGKASAPPLERTLAEYIAAKLGGAQKWGVCWCSCHDADRDDVATGEVWPDDGEECDCEG